MTPQTTHTAVLIGAGHAHLHLMRHAERLIHRGIEPVLVDPNRFWYSGLATGMLGGAYSCPFDQVDPAGLAERFGGRFVRDRVTGLDPAGRTVHLASGAELHYDAVSLNIGSETITSVIAGAPTPGAAGPVWTAKPIANLCRLRERLEERFRAGGDDSPLRVVVIGGGPTGCEIAANLDALARRRAGAIRITLTSRSDRLIKQHPAGASRCLTRALEERGVERAMSCEIQRIERDGGDGPGTSVAADGRRFEWDVLVIATGLRPPRLLEELPLTTGDDGGLRVTSTLQSVDDERIFGTGDCISMVGHKLPKLGVFGVRQAEPLLNNLIALLTGGSLKKYHPQKRWLTILHLGNREGLATWGPLYWRGWLSFWLKDRIDRRFLKQYREEPGADS